MIRVGVDERLGREEAEVELERGGQASDHADRLTHAELLQLGAERLFLVLNLSAHHVRMYYNHVTSLLQLGAERLLLVLNLPLRYSYS